MIPHCELCTDNTHCTRCATGFTDNLCSTCAPGYTTLPDCNVCANDHYSSSPYCYPCSGLSQYCNTCTDAATCTNCDQEYTGLLCDSCATGFYPVTSNPLLCSTCSVLSNECLECSNNVACSRCSARFTGDHC